MSLSKLNELTLQPQPLLSTFDSLTKRLTSYVAVVPALGEARSIARVPKSTCRPRLLLAICIVAFTFLGALHSSQATAATKNLILDGSFEKALCTTTDYDQPSPLTMNIRWLVGPYIPDWTPKPEFADFTLSSLLNWGDLPACFRNPNVYYGPTPYGKQFIALGYVNPFLPVSLLQTIKNVTPGGTYKLSFAIASEYGCCAYAQVSFPSGSKTQAKLFEAPAGELESSTYHAWTHWGTEHMTFVATKSSVTVDFTDEIRKSASYSLSSFWGWQFTPNGGGSLALDNVVVTPGTQLQLNAASGSDTAHKDVGSKPISATFPLGAKFSLSLKNIAKGSDVESTYTLSNPSIQPALYKSTLFPKTPVLEFDSSTASDTKYFRAVHMGTETLTITPSDSSLSPVTVNITVNKPTSLGSSHNQYDSELIKYANKRGIPPQYLKGQVEDESRFNPHSYRYEPLRVDMTFVSSGFSGIRSLLPYSNFDLATSDGIQEGPYVTEADLSPRDKYVIIDPVTGQCRYINDQDTLISAWEIYTTNDHISALCTEDNFMSGDMPENQNWSLENPKLAKAVAKNPNLLAFTAQTIIASSYGLDQMLYSTAIFPMRWSGEENGQLNPSYLFDTPTNLANGGGSLALGAGYLANVFPTVNPGVTTFSSNAVFARDFRRAFNRYSNSAVATGAYGKRVLKYSAAFLPVPAATIFH